MAAGSTYPADFTDADGIGRMGGLLVYTDSTKQPVPTTPPITSGTLPNTGAWVSGTAKVNPVARQVNVTIEVVTDGTANAATCVIALSPDNTTFTTLGTPGASAAVNTTGAITEDVQVEWPQGWYLKLTFAHCTVAASVYY